MNLSASSGSAHGILALPARSLASKKFISALSPYIEGRGSPSSVKPGLNRKEPLQEPPAASARLRLKSLFSRLHSQGEIQLLPEDRLSTFA